MSTSSYHTDSSVSIYIFCFFSLLFNELSVLLFHLCSRFQLFLTETKYAYCLTIYHLFLVSSILSSRQVTKPKTQSHLILQFLLHFFCCPLQVCKLLKSFYALTYLYLIPLLFSLKPTSMMLSIPFHRSCLFLSRVQQSPRGPMLQ